MRKMIAMLLAFSLLLSGCGADDGKSPAANDGLGSAENSVIENSGNTEAENGGNTGADNSGSTGENNRPNPGAADKLYLQERKSIPFAEPEEGYQSVGCFYDTLDGKFYLFRAEEPVEAETSGSVKVQRICMQVYDSGSQTLEQRILTPEISGHEEYQVWSAGLTPEGELSLKMSYINGKENLFFLVKTDLDGNVLETAEPFPDETYYPWNKMSFLGKGAFHLPDGRTVLCGEGRESGNSFVVDLLWFDGKSTQAFAQLDVGSPCAFSCDGDGLLYYVAGGALYRRDPVKDTPDDLFRLSDNGITNFYNMGMLFDEEGNILLCIPEQEALDIYVLSDQRTVSDAELLVACPDGTIGMEYIKRKASTFSYDTGGPSIYIEEAEGEDYRNRIIADMTAGKGPDMLLLKQDDLVLLTEKGYLSDLSDMIPADVKAELIPSVLEIGTVDGKLTGITPQVEFRTLITGSKTWEKDRWNITEFLELVQSKEDWEILASYLGSNMNCYTLFYWIFGSGIVNSSLLDLEQGICHFDSEEFVNILEVCKKYGEKNVKLEANEVNALLKEGEIAAKCVNIYDLAYFSDLMSQYGEGYRFVGFPVQEGIGTQISPYSFRYLAVNANSQYKEEIAEFIAYLLDYENQFSVNGCSVRLDVIRDRVVPHETFGYVINDDYGFVQPLSLKPDGTSWVAEFIDFVKSAQPEAAIPDEISEIMGSELPTFFEEGRSARETAENIQNRVQLYLDEKK